MFGAKSEEVATVRSNLGWLLFDQQQYAQAAEVHREVLALRRELFGAEHALTGSSLNDVGTVQIHLKQFADSQQNLEAALEILRKAQGPGTPDVAIVLGNLADLFRAQSDFAKAESYARQELAIRERLFGRQSKVVTESLTDIAGDLEKQNQPEAAKTLRDEAAKIAAALAIAKDTPENPFRVGQRVQVKAERASVMGGATELGYLVQGMEFEVTHVNGKWCGLKITVAGAGKSGWVDSNLLTLAAVVVQPPVELKHTLVSQEGNFSIKLPKPPTLSQETVTGIQHNAYTLEMPYGMFVVGYFDLPAGSELTFDAAVVALAIARNGLVESEDKISLEDEYAGRDWLIRLPESQYCRMRLYSVGARRYQIVLEGAKSFVASKQADAFFASFQRSQR